MTTEKQFPDTVYVRIEPDRGVDILVAGTDAQDALGIVDRAVLGVYRLEKIVDARRSVDLRDVNIDVVRRMNKKRPATKGNP